LNSLRDIDNECTYTDGAVARDHAIKSFKVLEGSNAATIAATWFEPAGVILVAEDKHDEPYLMGRASKKFKTAASAAPPQVNVHVPAAPAHQIQHVQQHLAQQAPMHAPPLQQ
jgi:hypothetical protein